MRVCFVNRFFHPDHSATSQMVSDLAFALAARGHEVSVVTSRLNYEDAAARLPTCETIADVRVLRAATTSFGRASLAGRLLDYVTFYVAAAWRLMFHLRPGDTVVVKTDPPLLSLVVTPIARMKRARVVNWMQDVYPEVMTALGMARNPLVAGAFRLAGHARDATLRRAHANVVIGHLMAVHLERLGIPSDRTAVIPNWADGRTVRPVAPCDNSLRRAWRLDDAFVVGYSGNLGRAHDVETILAAMVLLRDTTAHAGRACDPAQSVTTRRDRLEWLFVGGGAQMARLKCAAGAGGNANVTFRPYQPREHLSESLSAADVHLVSLQPSLEGLIVPSKIYGIAAAGRPAIFIGDPKGEIARLLVENRTGLVVPWGDGPALANAIRRLADDPALAREMGSRARALFEAHHDLPRAVDAWEQVMAGS